MAFIQPITLAARGIHQEPLGLQHEAEPKAAAAGGELRNIRITSVPEPTELRGYIETALSQCEAGNRFAFVVVDDAIGKARAASARTISTLLLRPRLSGWVQRKMAPSATR